MARPDPHSVYDDQQPRVRHLDWRLRVDFAARQLHGDATLTLEGEGELLDLDTRDLTIDGVVDEEEQALRWELGVPHPVLGRRLRVQVGAARRLRIRYRTSPQALALHWSNQSLYSQCQPIQARTLVPLCDSPSSRLALGARITAPRSATVLMGGEWVARHDDGELSTTEYAMGQPIPPYLLALAVGELAARDLSPRSRVWAAPAELERAAAALAGIERVIVAAEALLGPYRWGRCDLWIAPPSFPYGGMENPRLIFLAPSLLSDADALLAVVAHELAHAWFGNQVGIASVEHFWLNEGLALWAERRLLPVLGVAADAVAAHVAVGRRDLEQALNAFATQPELTRLRTHLDGLDPDETLSIVPYEKGYLFIAALEARIGAERCAELLRDYLVRYAGCVVESEQLMALVAKYDPQLDRDEWLNQSGLPASAPVTPAPPRLGDQLPPRAEAAAWSCWRWRWYLDGLTRPSPLCTTLDEWFNLSQAESIELRAAWLPLAVESDHAPALAEVEVALDGNHPRGGGRVKLLRPLYLALARNPSTRGRVGGWWRRFRDTYHPVARQQLDRLLRELGVATQDVNPLGLGLRRRP